MPGIGAHWAGLCVEGGEAVLQCVSIVVLAFHERLASDVILARRPWGGKLLVV